MRYIRFEKKGVNCNFLEIPEEKRKELSDMIRSCNEFDDDIEINIFRGPILEVMGYDNRIRKDIIRHTVSPSASGKALLPEELQDKYRDKKICYCCHANKFNKTITTVFHELYHFYDSFDIGENGRLEMRSGQIALDINLEFNIKNLLNEYFAEYRVVKQLSSNARFKDEFKEILMIQAKLKLWTNANLVPRNLKPNLELMNIIFGLINPLFHFMGFWRGFQEIGDDSDLQANWQTRISEVKDGNIINIELLNSLKSQLLLNKKIEKIEGKVFRIFEGYFRTVLNFQI